MMKVTYCAQISNFPSQYETAIHTAYARSVSRIEQPLISVSYSLIVVPVLLVSSIALYRNHRSRQLRKQAETLEQLWKLDQNDQNNVF
ncbi:hypothetical protein [Phormidesmis sp. 146-33]